MLLAGGWISAPSGMPMSVAGAVEPNRPSSPAYGSYSWPLVGTVLRGFEPPSSPYGSGHRGIDIAAPLDTPVKASADGTVAFAGWVAGSLFVSIDHPDGVRTTYSWLSSAIVRKGERVIRGQPIARSGQGHPEVSQPHLHFGARIGRTYIDPMLLLGGGSVVGLIHLAPFEDAAASEVPIQWANFEPRSPPK